MIVQGNKVPHSISMTWLLVHINLKPQFQHYNIHFLKKKSCFQFSSHLYAWPCHVMKYETYERGKCGKQI